SVTYWRCPSQRNRSELPEVENGRPASPHRHLAGARVGRMAPTWTSPVLNSPESGYISRLNGRLELSTISDRSTGSQTGGRIGAAPFARHPRLHLLILPPVHGILDRRSSTLNESGMERSSDT